jgi:hypothetical protein
MASLAEAPPQTRIRVSLPESNSNVGLTSWIRNSELDRVEQGVQLRTLGSFVPSINSAHLVSRVVEHEKWIWNSALVNRVVKVKI